jgi:predicted enzyme related to lactoylglutathione lyase
MNHTIMHFEIPADDLDKMKGFYTEVFGWKLIDVPEMQYVLIQTVPTDEKGMLKEPGVNGGMMKRTAKGQVPINYVQVESVDEFLERAVKNGGSVIMPKQHVPTVGYLSWIADPEGNPVGLLQPEMP